MHLEGLFRGTLLSTDSMPSSAKMMLLGLVVLAALSTYAAKDKEKVFVIDPWTNNKT